MVITLPSQVKVNYVSGTSNSLTCSFAEPQSLSITSCAAESSQLIKITLGSSLSGIFQIDIKNAISLPSSSTQTDSFILQTYNSAGVLQDSQSTGIQFTATTGTLTSLSLTSMVTKVVGATDTIKVSFKTTNAITSNGYIQLKFPYLFSVTKDNIYYSMIDTTELTCYDSTSTQTSCSFTSSSQTLTLSGIVGSSGIASSTTMTIIIKGVINPVSVDTIASITVSTTDSLLGAIDTGTVTMQPTESASIASATITPDSKIVQESTRYVVSFTIPLPLYAGCKINLFFPWPDYELTSSSISSVQGFGLFGSIRSLSYTIDSSQNAIVITDACQNYIIPTIAAQLYINGISNPDTVKQTGAFTISIQTSTSSDIAKLASSSGPTLTSTEGTISSISMVTSYTTISTDTDFTIYFTPAHSSSGMTKLEFTNYDTDFVIKDASLQSSSISNAVSDGTVTLGTDSSGYQTISVFLSNDEIVGGSNYYIKFKQLTTAGSYQSLSTLKISMYQQVSGTSGSAFYLINEGTANNLITTQQGQFLSVLVTPASYNTYASTSYTFDIQLENTIPISGYIVITIPSDVSVSELTCKYEGEVTACSSLSTTQIQITGIFTASSVNAQTSISITISTIINPRSLKTTGTFIVQSYDQSGNTIDYYSEANTQVTMQTGQYLTSASITSITSTRVGATNVGIVFKFKQDVPLISGDILMITMPTDMTLPSITSCSSSLSSSVTCSKSDSSQVVYVKLASALASSTSLDVTIKGFTNPSSGAPTGTFDASFYDSSYYLISSLQSSTMSVKMTQPYLITSGGSIAHDNAIASIATTITMSFQIAHDVPSGSTLYIYYPSQISIISTSSISVTSPQTSSTPTLSIDTTNRIIKATNFFSYYLVSSATLQLTIQGFKNSLYSAATDAFVVDTFTSEGYVIDRLSQSSLVLTNQCDYPCKECDQTVSSKIYCSSCLSQSQSSFYILEEQKCVEKCSTGYYFQGSNIQAKCLQCDSTCKTCDQQSVMCTSCDTKSIYPYLLNSQCLKTCPLGYYSDITTGKCVKCNSPCSTCSNSPSLCASCVSGTYLYKGKCIDQCPSNYYIGNDTKWSCNRCQNNCDTCQNSLAQCTSCLTNYKLNTIENTCIQGDCPSGTTEQNSGICSICNENCATCNGTINNCLTCVTSFLLNSANQCVAQCADGEVQIGNKCVKCQQGCDKCGNSNIADCTVCSEGYFNLNYKQCLASCPSGYEANSISRMCIDTSIKCNYGYERNDYGVCELKAMVCDEGYELNSILKTCTPIPTFFIPFPFIIILIISTIITLVYLKRGAKMNDKVSIVKCIICLWSLLEVPLYLIQFILAAAYNYWPVTAISFIGLALIFPVNCYAYYLNRQAEKHDLVFKHFINNHQKQTNQIRKLSLYYNSKFLRLQTCNYKEKEHFNAQFEDVQNNYIKPQLRISIITLLTSHLLILIADITTFIAVNWGYQLLITCIESFVFIIVISLLQIYEYWKIRKLMKSSDYYKINPKSIDITNVRSGFDDSMDQNGNGKKRRHSDRRHLLEKINQDIENNYHKKENEFKLYEYLEKNEETTKGKDPQEEYATRNLLPIQEHLSTQNHYGDQRPKLWKMDDGQQEDEQSQEIYEKCVSERDESEYWDTEALSNARDLFSKINLMILYEREQAYIQQLQNQLNEQIRRAEEERKEKTVDLNNSQHILSESMKSDDERMVVMEKARYQMGDVMGQFKRDENGQFIIVRDREGRLRDGQGRFVNEQGYLVDQDGNIVDRDNQKIVNKDELIDGQQIPLDIFKDLFLSRGSKIVKQKTSIAHLTSSLFQNQSLKLKDSSQHTLAQRNQKNLMSESEGNSVDAGRTSIGGHRNINSIRLNSTKDLNRDQEDNDYNDAGFAFKNQKSRKSIQSAKSNARKLSIGNEIIDETHSQADYQINIEFNRPFTGDHKKKRKRKNKSGSPQPNSKEYKPKSKNFIKQNQSLGQHVKHIPKRTLSPNNESTQSAAPKHTNFLKKSQKSQVSTSNPRQRRKSPQETDSRLETVISRVTKPRVPRQNRAVRRRKSGEKVSTERKHMIIMDPTMFTIQMGTTVIQENYKPQNQPKIQKQDNITTAKPQSKVKSIFDREICPFNLVDLKDNARQIRPQNKYKKQSEDTMGVQMLMTTEQIEKDKLSLFQSTQNILSSSKPLQQQQTALKYENLDNYLRQMSNDHVGTRRFQEKETIKQNRNVFNQSGQLILQSRPQSREISIEDTEHKMVSNLQDLKNKFYPQHVQTPTINNSIMSIQQPQSIIEVNTRQKRKQKRQVEEVRMNPQEENEKLKMISSIYSQDVRAKSAAKYNIQQVHPKTQLMNIGSIQYLGEKHPNNNYLMSNNELDKEMKRIFSLK